MTTDPAKIRKGLAEVTRLITDRRLSAALHSIGGDAKLFAKAKAKPKAFLATYGMKAPSSIATILRLSRQLTRKGRRVTLCVQTTYTINHGGVVYDANGRPHKLRGELHYESCTTVILPS